MMDSKDREDGFHCTGGTQKVPDGAFGAAHIDLKRFLLATFSKQQSFDCIILCSISETSRCCMGVDVVDLAWLQLSMLQRLSHSKVGACTIFLGSCHVICIG